MQHIRLAPSQVPYLTERQTLLDRLTTSSARLVRSAALPELDNFLRILDGNTVLHIQRGDASAVYYVGDWDGQLTAEKPIFVALIK